MKLEELTALGIPEEAAKKVLAQHEAEVSAETKKLTDKDAELTMAADKIRELSEAVKKFDGVDVDKMKSDIENWSKKYAEDTAALKLDNALSLVLAGCGAKDADIVDKLLDRSIIKLDGDGKLIGVSEQLERLKADKAFLFGSADEQQGARIDTGLDHQKTAETVSDAQARAIMGLPVAK